MSEVAARIDLYHGIDNIVSCEYNQRKSALWVGSLLSGSIAIVHMS